MKGSIKLILIICILALIIVATSSINSIVSSTKDPAWYLILTSIIMILLGTLASTLFGNLGQDILRYGVWETIKLWFSPKTSGEQPIDRALKVLADRCLVIAEKCLEEIDYKGIKSVHNISKKLRPNFIKNLNWIYSDKISLVRLNQSESTKKDPIEIRLLIDADEHCSFFEIFQEKSNFSASGFIVLGLPGFGKTFSIYDCIVKANSQKIVEKPVVFFSLSYWIKDRPLTQWMQDELEKSYKIPIHDAELIVSKHHLFPVFDGLDQVHPTLRNQCAKKIFDYSATNTIILTCRPSEFDEVATFLREMEEVEVEQFFTIMELLPLGDDQVKKIIREEKIVNNLSEKVFNKADEVIDLMVSNNDFGNLIRSPMILYIVWRIQDKLSKAELTTLKGKGNKESIEYLWFLYDKYIFEERPISSGDVIRRKDRSKIIFDDNKSRMWLHHIANKFSQKQSIFIEHLQPDFLIRPVDLITYVYISRILTSILLAGATGFFLSGPTHFMGAGVLAGVLVATITLLYRSLNVKLPRFLRWLSKIKLLLVILLFSLPLLFLLTLFLGFATPRGKEDMIFHNTFAITEANVAVLLALFIGFSHGVRERYSDKGDIRPVEQIALNSLNAAWFGLKGGLLLGFFLIICVKFIQLFGSTFDGWVKANPYGINIYIFAMLIGVILGAPMLSLLRMLDDNRISVGDDEKKRYSAKPNYGISKSVWNLGMASLIIGLVMVSVLGLFSGLLSREPSCLIKGIRAGLGASLLASLLFGGFDVINHFVLRLVIYFNGYGPRSFTDFFAFSSRLRLTRTVGASFNFVHDTIGDYYRGNGRLKLRNGYIAGFALPITIICLLTMSIWFMIDRRYSNSFYWSNPNGFVVDQLPNYMQRLNTSTFLIKKTDTVTVTAKGDAYLGTFIGYVGPEGTEAGFIGLRLGDAYDIDMLSPFPHGALIIKRLNRAHPQYWSFAEDVTDWKNLLPNTSKQIRNIHVFENDTIQFIVNDREWQNNFSKFKISITGTQRVAKK